MRNQAHSLLIRVLVCVALGFAQSARAQDAVADFYRGKQVNLIVGYVEARATGLCSAGRASQG